MGAQAAEANELLVPVHKPQVESLPLYELGFGVGGSIHPDYPGADQSHGDVLPIPYAVYRGKILYADKRGNTRARFLRTDIYELSLSGAGGFPVKASENSARTGMSDLDWMGQVGPRFLVRLHEFDDGTSIKLGLPARAVFTASSDFRTFKHRGFMYEPELILDVPHFFSDNASLFALASVAAADQNFMQYLYGVSASDATASRAQFNPRAGYFYSTLTLGFSIDLFGKRLRVMPAAELSTLEGATNEASPLVKTNWNASFGLVVIPVFYRSEKLVKDDD